ncbi:LOW QUALITY PROTEIN: uncharacterized protein LOC108117310 [Drosophila eugracilis]|uniref:LOW QUALITY PROTEIN: uncharacterized protein LOC108117310 n=1 Tax=Drosophila eugracilis TaxID=29029 RepID=UPI001BD9C370|nr:LOW QUALITY PROTEIN: uncharacterized protein LOC108117310 [Drosophila eugracilis]
MVTCKVDSQTAVAVPKMNAPRTRGKPAGSNSNSNSSGFRLLDGDQLENNSSVSRNSIYKLKIDLMFDDSRSMRSSRLDDPRGSHRTRSIIMYGRSELASNSGDTPRSLSSFLQDNGQSSKVLAEAAKKDVQRISNNVQAQIEQLFTDVAKDATSSFDVTYLGSLPLKDKVTSLQGLQEPLRQLYLSEVTKKQKLNTGSLDICATGLRVKISAMAVSNGAGAPEESEAQITPFHNIAVWSAVKFIISDDDGGAAFLPLITDPENIDKTALFQPLSSSEQLAVENSIHVHAPIFAVVMRSASSPKGLECHGFICKSTEDAIVIAATLYQSLMAHVSTSSRRNTQRRAPRQQNGVSCVSIASSSALASSNYLSRSQIIPSACGRRSSFRGKYQWGGAPSRSGRKKRVSNSSLSSHSNVINETAELETSTEERRRKSHKSKRAPPVPTTVPCAGGHRNGGVSCRSSNIVCGNGHVTRLHQNGHPGKKQSVGSELSASVDVAPANGDILTRVAIPRSGSFLNTGGLTRYKSRAARRHSGKLSGGGGGGGGSPLGFSELFNEFRLHENLHSLDDILYAIIDADGMSFNDLKPIYKEFLLKLAVTLTQDELFQRSKNIMRRQKKKKQKRKASVNGSQKKARTSFFGTKSLKKVFQLSQFRSCRGKLTKPAVKDDTLDSKRKPTISAPIIIGQPIIHHSDAQQQHQRNRAATSGSDVSVVRNEHTQGLNRNSSSGYVSCSECSYDSESCACASADRCYCSLRTEHLNHKLRQKNERNMAMATPTRKPTNNGGLPQNVVGTTGTNRHSLISCRSDDKCYCSMVEEEPASSMERDSANNSHTETTTSCDSDSCVSASKCYCKRTHRRQRSSAAAAISEDSLSQQQRKSRPGNAGAGRKGKASDKLGLDYELFSISGSGQPVQPHEALSVKKSVEAAAVFADMKLSQTTDIKSLCPPKGPGSRVGNGSCRSHASSRRSSYRTRESFSTDRLGGGLPLPMPFSKGMGMGGGGSADNLLANLKAMEAKAASIRSSASRSRMGSYQSMRAVSASLEDSLGYLP